jgi:NAD(P)H dehydrogenase (quinone)
MKILIILAHPSPSSFNHAIADKVVKTLIEHGHEVLFHDLYSEKFDPMLPIEEISKKGKVDNIIIDHCNELVESKGIVIIHPNWWGMPPAILKGWVDRVIRPGVAYKFVDGDSGEGIPVGLLKADKVLIINTSDTEEFRENEIFGDPLERIWKDCIFGLCGITNFHRVVFRTIVTSDFNKRQNWLLETSDLINKLFPSKS